MAVELLTTVCPQTVNWTPKGGTKIFTSPHTGDDFTKDRLGGHMTCVLDYPAANFKRTELAELEGKVAGLQGASGRFLLYPFQRPVPMLNDGISGAPVTSGTTVAGAMQLNATGFTGTLSSGDFFSLGGELKMVTKTLTNAGVLAFAPRIRQQVASGAALVIDHPTGKFRLIDDDQGEFQHMDSRAGVTIACKEVWP